MNDVERYTEVKRSQHITQTDTRVYGQSYVVNTSSINERSAFLNEPAQHDHVDCFHLLPSSVKRAFRARFQPKKRLPSGGIHSLWNSRTKSTISKTKMPPVPKSKRPEAKLVVIATASLERACSNINSNGFGGGGTGKS